MLHQNSWDVNVSVLLNLNVFLPHELK